MDDETTLVWCETLLAQPFHEQQLYIAHESLSILLKVPHGSAGDELKESLTNNNGKVPNTEVLGTSSRCYLVYVDYPKYTTRSTQWHR